MSGSRERFYYNEVKISGYAADDADEPGRTNGGKRVCNFRFGNNASRNRVSFFKVEVFGKKLSKRAAKIKKGDGVILEGRIRVDEWEKDGNKHRAVVITAYELKVIPKSEREKAKAVEGLDATQGAEELAAEEGVDLTKVTGSGHNGRILKGDVEQYVG